MKDKPFFTQEELTEAAIRTRDLMIENLTDRLTKVELELLRIANYKKSPYGEASDIGDALSVIRMRLNVPPSVR